MKPEQQQIAIAEACGWYECWSGSGRPPLLNSDRCDLPDYLNDLNAMHEAEKVLNPLFPHDAPWVLYRLELLKLCGDAVGHATASHRAEAFLRTIEKWVEP